MLIGKVRYGTSDTLPHLPEETYVPYDLDYVSAPKGRQVRYLALLLYGIRVLSVAPKVLSN